MGDGTDVSSNNNLDNSSDCKKRLRSSNDVITGDVSAEEYVNEISLKKEIGLLEATSVMTGVMIGSGIFVSPVSITANTGSIGLSLTVWVLSGLLVLAIALSYTELAGIFPKSGGEYNFYKQTYGPLPAFLVAFNFFTVVSPAFLVLLALTTGTYLFQPFFSGCGIPGPAVKLFTVWLLLTIAVLNSLFLKYATRVQTFFFFTKIAALSIISITGIVQLCYGRTENLLTGFEGSSASAGSLAVAMYAGVFTYNGWQCLFILLDEVKNPAKIVPRATFLSFLLVIIIYFFTNIAYFTVMTPADMIRSPAVAVEFAEKTLGRFSLIVPLFVACSTIGALNASFLGGSRMYYAAARDGLFPVHLTMLHPKYKVPLPSVWATFVVCILYVTYDNAVSLIEYLGFMAGGLLSLASMIALLVLRRTRSEVPRPFKVPIVIPITATIVVILLNILALYQAPRQNGIGVLLVLAGIPVYIVCVSWKNKPKTVQRAYRSSVYAIQKLLGVVVPDR